MKRAILWGVIIALSFAVLVSHLSFIGGIPYLQTHQMCCAEKCLHCGS